MPQSPEQTPRNQDYRTFNDKLFAEFHEWMADLVHENLPGIPVHVKLMAGGFSTMSDNNIKHLNYGYNIEEFMEFCDVNGLDGGGNYEGGEFLINEFIETSHLSVYSSYDRHTSLLNAPVYNTEDHMIRDGSENWVDEQAQHVGRHIWQGAVHGRGASAIWVWATSYTNETLRGSILYRPDCILEAGRSAMDLNRLSYEVSALQDTDRDIGILYSYMNQNYNYIYNDSSFSVYSGLVYNGMLPLFVSERQLDRMQDVKILFVPYVTNAYEETIDAINKYLDEGGKVIILGDDSLKLDDKNQPHDEDKIKNIYERSVCLAIETDTGNRRMTSPDLYELTDYIHSVLEENNMDIVRLVDAKTGLPPRNVEWISAYYNGKLLVNVCNFGDYDDVKNLNVYVRGEKVGTMQELRFNQMIDTTVAVDPGKPLLLQIDTDTAFMDTYRHWAEESITSLENMGIVSGITQTKFCPEKSLTRAEWTALLMRAAGKSGSSDNSISDAEGHWAQAEINAAYRLGILDGMVTDGYFEPDKEITRDEMAGMLYNTLTKVMGKTLSENGEFHFADEDKLVNKAAVKAIAASGLVSGYPDNTFKGNRSLTRAEAAAVLKRMIDL